MAGRKWFAMGDPQAPFARVLEVLRGHGLLDESSRLQSRVGLVSMGDHFDFPPERHDRSLEEASQDGTDTLRWLASHPSDQVVILLGNHDACRVMELAWETDASFAEARRMASGPAAAFHRAFPRIPTPDIAKVDFSTFAEHQRETVQALLLEGRFHLGVVGRLRDGTRVLLTHAGVTDREVALLGVDAEPLTLASALGRHLRSAVERVRSAWERGEAAALDLRPLHEAGTTGVEGGGLLYHRASVRGEAAGGTSAVRRRFHPNALPRGLVQVCGHTGHSKSVKELGLGEDPAMHGHGGLRTLAVGPAGFRYERRIVPAREDEATMYLVDVEMAHREVRELPLFELDDVVVPSEGSGS